MDRYLRVSMVGSRRGEQVRVLLSDVGVVRPNNGSAEGSPDRVEGAGERRVPDRVVGIETDNGDALRRRHNSLSPSRRSCSNGRTTGGGRGHSGCNDASSVSDVWNDAGSTFSSVAGRRRRGLTGFEPTDADFATLQCRQCRGLQCQENGEEAG